MAGRAAHSAAARTTRSTSRWRAARRTTGWCGAGWACASAAARRAPTTWAGSGGRGRGSRRSASCPAASRRARRSTLSERTFALTLGRPVQFPLYSTTRRPRRRAGRRGRRSTEDVQAAAADPHACSKGARGKAATVPVHLAGDAHRDRHARAVLRLATWRTSAGGSSSSCAARRRAGELTVTESMPARFAEATRARRARLRQQAAAGRPEGREEARRARSRRCSGPRETLARAGAARAVERALRRRREAPPLGGPRARLLPAARASRCGRASATRSTPGAPSRRSGSSRSCVQHHTREAGVDRVLGDVAAHRRRARRGAQREALRATCGRTSSAGAAGRAEARGEAQGHPARGARRDGARGRLARAPASRTRRWSWATWSPRACAAEAKRGRPVGVGARAARARGLPLYGSGHRVVDAGGGRGVARRCCSSSACGRSTARPFAVAQLARLTGDRTRDLDDGAARARRRRRSRAAKAPDALGADGAPRWSRWRRRTRPARSATRCPRACGCPERRTAPPLRSGRADGVRVRHGPSVIRAHPLPGRSDPRIDPPELPLSRSTGSRHSRARRSEGDDRGYRRTRAGSDGRLERGRRGGRRGASDSSAFGFFVPAPRAAACGTRAGCGWRRPPSCAGRTAPAASSCGT